MHMHHKSNWKEIKAKFWKDLERLLKEIGRGQKIIIRGDLSDHLSREVNGYKDVHGCYGFGKKLLKEKLSWTLLWHMISS